MFMAHSEKLRELMLYLAMKCESDTHFGAVKLNKILFAIDVSAYLAWRHPITEAEYIALELGPVPRQLSTLRTEMVQQGDAAVRLHSFFGMMNAQERLIALREPNLDLFTGPEIALIDTIIEGMAPYNEQELTEWSHRFIGWKAVDKGEAIPYESALISAEPPTPYDVQRTQQLIQKYDW